MKQVVCLFLLVSIISNCLLISVEADDDDRNAFDNNINECLFNDWKEGETPILASNVDCDGDKRFGLCYGINKKTLTGIDKIMTLFAVCYNNETLIPEFSGHVVNGEPIASGRADDWVNEAGPYAPYPQSEKKVDYDPYKQKEIVPNFNDKTNFYSGGHLTPNNVFHTGNERDITMINTNAAPQWQVFNSQNWAVVEKAVRSYTHDVKRPAYVVTGTGGTLLDKENRTLLLNERVVAPGYFWKAVCDPVAKQSEVLVAANPTGTSGTGKKVGCDINQKPQKMQTRDRGIVNCYSLDELKKRPEAKYFNLPNFAAICNPQTRGTFLDPYLKKLS